MSDLGEFGRLLKNVKTFENQLLKGIASSFVFSLLAAFALTKGADLSSRAEVGLIATVTGATGLLTAFLGNIRHPTKEQPLEYNFYFSGTKTAVVLLLAAFLYYMFCTSWNTVNSLPVLYLGGASFLNFYGLTSSVLLIRRAELQTELWHSMSAAERLAWVAQNQERAERIREAGEFAAEARRTVQESKRRQKYVASENRSQKFRAFLSRCFVTATLRIRRRMRLLTTNEELQEIEAANLLQKLVDDDIQKILKLARQGKAQVLSLESGINLHSRPEGGSREIILIEEHLDTTEASTLLEKLDALPRDEKGQFTKTIIAVGRSAVVSYDARKLLKGHGFKIVDENPVENATD